jgi:hypothetical protein
MLTRNQDEEWKELCRQVANEPDPEKFTQLLNELIYALDTSRRPTGDNGESVKTASGSVGGEK